MIYISVKNKKILDNIIEIFDNNELKFCYDNDDMYSLIRKSTIVVTDSNPTVIKFALKEKKQIIILTSKEKMTKLEKNYESYTNVYCCNKEEAVLDLVKCITKRGKRKKLIIGVGIILIILLLLLISSLCFFKLGTKEKKVVIENKIDFKNKKILEIGCGIGRWAEVFHDKCDSYLGIDFSEDLIEIAKENYNYDNCHFQVLSASQLDTADLLVNATFDIVIITGVLIYFNDDTIKKMIKDLNSLCASNKTIYIRETLSFLETRLTLKDFFYENLEADYNKIY